MALKRPVSWTWVARLRPALPALAFALRTVAAVNIALGIAFALELDQAYWAGTTAALVCQPVLGSALRKALFRAVGTLTGAVMAVVLFACFPQDRIGFTLAFAGWCALCGFVSTRLNYFAAYGAALAGYTTAIIVGDVINTPNRAFSVALARVTEIELGIAVATTVLAVTLVDQVSGEALHWCFRLGPVRAAQDALFACFADTHRLRMNRHRCAPSDTELVHMRETLPECLLNRGHGGDRLDNIEGVRAEARALSVLGEREPYKKLGAARAARALSSAADALEIAAWLTDPARPHPAPMPAFTAPVDPLPALLTAMRAYLGVAAAVVLWTTTRWPNGPTAITWTAIPILLASTQQEKAYSSALAYSLGTLLASGLAAITKFAVLPQLQSFGAFAVALAVPLVPLAALSANPSLTPFLGPAAFNFIPLIAPANQMSYDPGDFYNTAFGIFGGCMIAGVALRLLPPPSARVRARRIVESASGDGAAIRAGTWRPSATQWLDRMRTRAAGLPIGAEPQAFTQLLTIFSLGDDVLRARTGSAACLQEIARADH